MEDSFQNTLREPTFQGNSPEIIVFSKYYLRVMRSGTRIKNLTVRLDKKLEARLKEELANELDNMKKNFEI